jgi:hypothetical protein
LPWAIIGRPYQGFQLAAPPALGILSLGAGPNNPRRRRPDYINDFSGPGDHDDMAAVHFMHGGSHTLRQEALQIRLNGPIVFGHDVPVGLRFPSLRI